MTQMPWFPRFRVWPIKLPLNLAVVYEGAETINTLPPVYTAVQEAVDFYSQHHIVLQPSVRAVTLEHNAYQELIGAGAFEPMHTHAFRLDGAPMTVIYLSHESQWRQQHLGDSYGHHLAGVAGNHGLAAETLIHEIGHLLLSDPPSPNDHENGTFMQGIIWNFTASNVTQAQRTRMYESAYLLGSL